MSWNAIQYVTGPLALCAFLTLAILHFGVHPALRDRESVKGFFKLLEKKLEQGELYRAIRFSGLVLLFLFCVSVAADLYTRPSDVRTVDVRIECDGEVVPAEFTLTYSLPGQPPQEARGQSGWANVVNVPRSLNSLNVLDLQMEGYTLSNLGAVACEGSCLTLRVESMSLPSSEDYPEVPIAYLANVVEQPAKLVDPSKVLFHIENRTGERIWICLYRQDANALQARWITIRDFTQPFARFQSGDGWYVAFVRIGPGQYRCLGTVNLFVDEEPELMIHKSITRYVGEFKNVKRSSNSCP